MKARKTKVKPTATAKAAMRQVGCRFYDSELSAMKRDTGATSDATAVTCFVRKRLDGAK